MLGLKNLPLNKLTTAFMVISAAMMIFAVAGSTGGSTSTTMLFIWIACALVLFAVWAAVAYEVFKRFFGGNDSATERGRSTSHR